jgi:hypothetical protein
LWRFGQGHIVKPPKGNRVKESEGVASTHPAHDLCRPIPFIGVTVNGLVVDVGLHNGDLCRAGVEAVVLQIGAACQGKNRAVDDKQQASLDIEVVIERA